MKTLKITWKKFLGIMVIAIVIAFTTMETLPAANQGGPSTFIVECQSVTGGLTKKIISKDNPSEGIVKCLHYYGGKVVSVTPRFKKKVNKPKKKK